MDHPAFLMVMDQATSSGATITNYGAHAGNYAIANHDSQTEAEGTNYSWHAGAGIYTPSGGSANGYLQSLTASGTKQVYLTTSATAPTQQQESVAVSIGFRVTAYSNGRFDPLSTGTGNGGPYMSFQTQAGTGDFDMGTWNVTDTSSATISATTLPTALSFGTDYIFTTALDYTTPTAVQARFKFGANSIQKPATADWHTANLEGAWPMFLRSFSLSTYFGLQGRINFIAVWRGGTPLGDTEVNAIHSDPTQIPGWPGAATIDPGMLTGSKTGVLGPLQGFGMMFRRAMSGLLVPPRVYG